MKRVKNSSSSEDNFMELELFADFTGYNEYDQGMGCGYYECPNCKSQGYEDNLEVGDIIECEECTVKIIII